MRAPKRAKRPRWPAWRSTSDEETSEDEALWLFLPVSEHLNVPGVEAAARVGDYEATASIGGRQQPGRILGIDRIDLPQVAFFRSDFAYNESLGELMNRLAIASDGILVSGGFLQQQGLVVGDPLRLTIGTAGEYAEAEFTVVGSLALFPTLYPQDGPFFVANLDHIHKAFGGTYPYDVWLSTDCRGAGRHHRRRRAGPGPGGGHGPGCPDQDPLRADTP